MDKAACTLNLGGSAITLEMLDLIVGVANRHGEVTVVNVGETNLLLLAADLLSYAKSRENKNGT
jgi:hypothetical protein